MNHLLEVQIQKAQERFSQREKNRERNIRLINDHRYFDIDSPQRVKKFLDRRGMSKYQANEILRSEKGIPVMPEIRVPDKQYLGLERILGTNDLVGVSFLHAAIEISRTVGRIWICGPGNKLMGYGTGFMVSPTLMMTNHHVLPYKNLAKECQIEFKYELDRNNNLLGSQSFSLNPDSFYFTNPDLDFSLVAVIPENAAKYSLGEFGWNKLSADEGKTIISQWLNIIQHPNGMPKQIGLRENQLIDVLDNFLHYKTDTSPGSSGSPVFNERWEVVALHHAGKWQEDKDGNIVSVSGGKWTLNMGDDQIKWIANEGIRVSSILKYLDSVHMNTNEQRLYDELRSAMPPKSPMSSLVNQTTKPMTTESTMNPDGSITMRVPLTVTFKLGGDITIADRVPPSTDGGTKSYSPIIDANSPPGSLSGEKEVLAKAKKEFMEEPPRENRNVVNVRLGYVFKNGWITKERALVVSVLEKKSVHKLKKEEVLPPKFMGYPVEVSTPTIEELITEKFSHDKFESIVTPAPVMRDEITYFGLQNMPLEEFTDTMRVIAHVSPEEGWNVLKTFLSDAKKTLTVGMYDFGSPHILKTIVNATSKSAFKKMILTLQPGESLDKRGAKKDDLKDKKVVEQLSEALGNKFENAWIRKGPVNGWISSSYHIKVAVKDSRAFWLSSGNWQSSNQPDLIKVKKHTPKFLLDKFNREWHAVVENEKLAKTFEAYIKHDFDNNKDYVPRSKELILDELNFLVPTKSLTSAQESTMPLSLFRSFDKKRKFTVKPLLTPDNYFDEVLSLIKSAKHELLIQNQTFNAPKEGQASLEEIVNAVLERQREGVQVKIIFRSYIASVARENLEKLVDMGFDPDNIKVHDKVHTKGIIVDRKKVLIGSQNISNDGVSVNRDASLLFTDTELANWFREIFMHDYTNLAQQYIGNENLAIELAGDAKEIPEGMELVTWTDIKEYL